MFTLRRGLAAAAAVAVIVVVVVLLTRGSSPHRTPTAKPPAPSGPQFGANLGPLFNGARYGGSVVNSQLVALAATGVTLVRSDAPWAATEPHPPQNGVHQYDWTFDDLVAAVLANHGFRWLPIIDYSASWAESVAGQNHSPPNSTADYAAYAAAFAQRYGDNGAFWKAHPSLHAQPIDTYEIWNEPDSGVFWYPHPDPHAYASLYLSARAAIKSVQAGAHVIVGGLAHPTTFIPALIAAAPALKGQLDGVGIHPYGSDPNAVVANVRASRAALNAQGLDTVPLYITEFGWTTSPPGALGYAPEQQRPGYIEQALADLGHLQCGLAMVILYAWMTTQRDRSNSNDWYGINPPAGGGSADVRAFTAGLRAATAPAPAISCG